MENPLGAGLRTFSMLALLLILAPAAWAQNYFCVEHKGRAYIVQKVYNGSTYIKEGDKLVGVKKGGFLLTPAPEYLPLFVSVRNLKVSTSYLSDIDSGSELNNRFHFQASFESAYTLPDAFLVIELQAENGGTRIYFKEIGTITPPHSTVVQADIRLGYKMGEGSFQLHVFTGGQEIFHSEQPREFREKVMDGMIRQRIVGVTNANPSPFIGPVPEYPKQFLKKKTAGSARVHIHLTSTGVVLDPVVERATDPAFGDSAVEAVRQWRFLPRIKDGEPVESEVNMPFQFEPPAETEKN